MNELEKSRTQRIVSLKNYHVVEWSPSQKCFHLQTLEEMIRDNGSVFKGESMTDYLCIGIFETYQQASNYISNFREMSAAESRGK